MWGTAAQRGALAGMRQELTCGACGQFFVQPMTLPCGCTFCRSCAIASINEVDGCSACRVPCRVEDLLLNLNVVNSIPLVRELTCLAEAIAAEAANARSRRLRIAADAIAAEDALCAADDSVPTSPLTALPGRQPTQPAAAASAASDYTVLAPNGLVAAETLLPQSELRGSAAVPSVLELCPSELAVPGRRPDGENLEEELAAAEDVKSAARAGAGAGAPAAAAAAAAQTCDGEGGVLMDEDNEPLCSIPHTDVQGVYDDLHMQQDRELRGEKLLVVASAAASLLAGSASATSPAAKSAVPTVNMRALAYDLLPPLREDADDREAVSPGQLDDIAVLPPSDVKTHDSPPHAANAVPASAVSAPTPTPRGASRADSAQPPAVNDAALTTLAPTPAAVAGVSEAAPAAASDDAQAAAGTEQQAPARRSRGRAAVANASAHTEERPVSAGGPNSATGTRASKRTRTSPAETVAPAASLERVPSSSGGTRSQLVLAGSLLPEADAAALARLASMLGVELRSSVRACAVSGGSSSSSRHAPQPRLTHVVVSTMPLKGGRSACKRTIKYLHGLLQGAWIVGTDWVTESLRLGRPAPEAAHEVSGDVNSEGAPRRGREARSTAQPPLLAGRRIVLWPPFEKMTADDVSELLHDAGADVVTAGGARAEICLTSRSREGRAPAADAYVTQSWLLDSISMMSPLDFGSYAVTAAAGGKRR